MLTSPEGLALIKHFEGFRPNVYLDAAGLPTVGVGHLIRPGEDFSAGISEAQGDELLAKDLGKAESAVARLTPRQLSQGQFDALVAFTFNVGPGAYQRSTLRQCVAVGHDDLAVEQFGRWTRAGGRVLPGLVRRRAAEAELYRRGCDA